MLKKIILFIFLLVIPTGAFSAGEKVEDVFGDIDSSYKYLFELQELYDKGIIKPDVNGDFNPSSLLRRDEFVGIVSEITCTDCIQPETSLELFGKYREKNTFLDIPNTNKYFYCIEDSSDKGFISGYQRGSICDNGSTTDSGSPFCPSNAIILEEALAITMKASGLISEEEIQETINQINSGEITTNLAQDVSPRNSDGSAYSFYPHIKKALDYTIRDVNPDGTERVINLLELTDGKIRPKKSITKGEFLSLAYSSFRANSCLRQDSNELAINLSLLNQSCQGPECSSKPSFGDTVFDLGITNSLICEEGINDENGYLWRFYNPSTSKQFFQNGKYLDNYEFLSPGVWQIFGNVVDNCGNSGEGFLSIFIPDSSIDSTSGLGVEIDSTPLTGDTGTEFSFESIVEGGNSNYSYRWDFGDSNISTLNNPSHNFSDIGNYEVGVLVTDSDGNESSSKITIQVTDDNSNGLGVEIDSTPLIGDTDTEFSFESIVEGGNSNYSYRWDFGDSNISTLNNPRHIFTDPGNYIIALTVTDSDGKVGKSEVSVLVKDNINNGLTVSIDAEPIEGDGPLRVDLQGFADGGDGPYVFSWNFGDSETGFGENTSHIFRNRGVYNVLLTATDKNGVESTSSLLIRVGDQNCSLDSDNDGVDDCLDKCPLVNGDGLNSGCPIFYDACSLDSDCPLDSYCDKSGEISFCKEKEISTNCEYSGGDLIYGNVVCNSCPCENFLDFTSTIRKCDIIFPAITSPDGKEIFSKGNLFRVE